MPDNIPIVILIATVSFFTWYALYKAVENDKRTEAGEVPVEALPETEKKFGVGPILFILNFLQLFAGTVFL